ncbi:DUF29 domain-containing protein [Nostoc sp. TCL26-01]|uniref:DUF29 domain-containing protein n=1 Tax=Nostoc sp. TCL26-01 TaxID=2576904 RepID=UPI0015BDD565|nr:DUF29 domain-containing protein [Nostoc sp. TCL26-01]
MQLSSKTLYETDYNQWVEETVQHLQAQDFASVDWANLIEEIIDLSRRQKDKLKSLLTRLFEHLLKLGYWQSEREYNGNHWKGEIRAFRTSLVDVLQDSPSLKPYFVQVFAKCYETARKVASDVSGLPLETFPVDAIATPEEVLDENWFPSLCNENSH